MCRRGPQLAEQVENRFVVLEADGRKDLDPKLGGSSREAFEHLGADTPSLPRVGHRDRDLRTSRVLILANEPRNGDDLFVPGEGDEGFVAAMVDPCEVIKVAAPRRLTGWRKRR